MNGADAKIAYDKAAALVKEGKYEEARAVEMLPSDKSVIEAKIAEHIRSCANGGVVQRNTLKEKA